MYATCFSHILTIFRL